VIVLILACIAVHSLYIGSVLPTECSQIAHVSQKVARKWPQNRPKCIFLLNYVRCLLHFTINFLSISIHPQMTQKLLSYNILWWLNVSFLRMCFNFFHKMKFNDCILTWFYKYFVKGRPSLNKSPIPYNALWEFLRIKYLFLLVLLAIKPVKK
jgi:hypothetical protein